MFNTKNTSSLLAFLAIGALLITFISFFFPWVTLNILVSISYSAIKFIQEGAGGPFNIILILCIIGFICACLSVKTRKAAIGTILATAIGETLVLISFSAEDDFFGMPMNLFNFADWGVYLYIVMNLVAISSSVAFMFVSKNTASAKDGDGHKIIDWLNKAVAKKQKNCPKCNATVASDAMFCTSCGTELKSESAFYTPTPTSTTPSAPTPPTTLHTTPTSKGDRNAICPHCGARQSSSNTHCKYCNTPMK